MQYLRFSMRTILTVMSFAAVGLGLTTWQVRQLNQIASDVSFLRKARAHVDLDRPDSTIFERLAPSFSGRPTSVRKHFDTPTLADVDTFVAVIERNPTITELTVNGSPLDDIYVKRLLQLQLTRLCISQCSTGDTLEARASDSITWLGLQRTRVNDRSLAAMGNLPNLKHLDLTRTRVSDDSIEFISKLPSLKTVILRRCKISDNGRNRLESLRPDIAIHWEPLRDKTVNAYN